jgi:hypothetical protein
MVGNSPPYATNALKDPKTYMGRIDRLVPRQTAVVYFSVMLPSPNASMDRGWVKSIVHKGGLGRTGVPTSWRDRLSLASLVVTLPLAFVLINKDEKRKARLRHIGVQKNKAK